jgi:serine/threonine protein kinase
MTHEKPELAQPDGKHPELQGAMVDQEFRDLLEASSLGSPAARRIRSLTSDRAVVDVRRRIGSSRRDAEPGLGVRPGQDMPRSTLENMDGAGTAAVPPQALPVAAAEGTPPIEVETGAARLRLPARGRRLLSVGASDDSSSARSRTDEHPRDSGDVMGDEEHGGALRLFADFSVGSRIAGYRLEEQIGQGGTAVVFRAQDERLPRQVALKILSPALTADDEFRHRFIRESRSAAAVDEPHIVPVFEAGDANGVLFIAMRYVPSGDAGTLVRRLGPLPIPQATAMISAVASALDAAHAVGLVHRDVKPSNMLVDTRPGRPDHVYLSDFGLTKGGQASATQTGTGHFLGTPTYCAPEQIRGQPVDARADEYALACAAFMLLSGEPPFLRDEGLAVLYAHLYAPPPRLTPRRRDLPAAVDDVLVRALAKAPQDRYASCGEFADELRMAFGLQRYDSDVAVVLHQRALTDQQRRLGLDHADALASRASLAAARQQASRSDEAITVHQRTLAARRQSTRMPAPPSDGQLCTMLAVDIAGFTRPGRDDEIRLYLLEKLYDVLERAFDGSGIRWGDCFHEDRGDGALIVIPPDVACKGIIDPLPERLRGLIRRHNHVSYQAAGIQLRAAAHIGPVEHDGHGFVGADINLLFRMLEARPLRRALAGSRAELALIVSDEVYRSLVRRCPSLVSPEVFQQVRFQVKHTGAQAWIYLPG